MNNNKKYKKWSLGLVAPALVLAPIAVVASCSSSGEEKEAYGIEFKATQIRAKIHNATQPNDLTDEQFKEEVLNHLDELFTVTGKLPADDFISKNIEIGELQKNNDKKEVSAKVKVNNANTDGKAIEETITLTGLGFDLTTLKYDISFKESGEQEIQLTGQENVSVTEMNEKKLIELVLTKENKDKILVIDGDNKNDITDEVLASQILKVTELNPTATEGKVTFKLSIEKPVNGAGETLTKEITFAGFKKETDAPETPKYKITLKATTPEKEYEFSGIESQLASSYNTVDKIRDLIIENKETMFELNGEAPTDPEWWKEKLVITTPSYEDTQGKIKFNLVLEDSNTMEDATDSNNRINERDIYIKGFQIKIPETGQKTTIKQEISTVTLGLNGSFEEVKKEVTPDWIAEKKGILFQQGTEPISKETISLVKHEAINGETGKFNLKFTLGNYYGADGRLTTTPKEFTIKINGISSNPTKDDLLRNKSGAGPLSVALVDPALAQKTYDEYKNDSANIFTKEFVFKYRKHLLTGDFSQIDAGTADDFLFEYPEDSSTSPVKPATFVKVIPDDSGKTIEIKFTILKEKLVPTQTADKEYSIIFNGFKGN